MDQGNQTPSAGKPIMSKWLWISLIAVVIIAAGYFSWYYLKGPGKKTATTNTTTTTTTSTAKTIAGWQTYTNSTYGLVFQYPSGWSFYTSNQNCKTSDDLCVEAQSQTRNQNDSVASSQSEGDGVTVEVQSNTSNLNARDFAKNDRGSAITNWSQQTVTINGISGVKLTTNLTNQVIGDYSISYLPKNNLMYIIHQNQLYGSSTTIGDAIYNQIISTFQINTVSAASATAGWQTYTDLAYNFSFKYPSDFSIKASAVSFLDNMGANCQTITLNSNSSIMACDATANLTSYGLQGPDGLGKYTVASMTIGGQMAKTYTTNSSVDYVVLSPNSNRIVLDTKDISSQNLTILGNILSTFQFTN